MVTPGTGPQHPLAWRRARKFVTLTFGAMTHYLPWILLDVGSNPVFSADRITSHRKDTGSP